MFVRRSGVLQKPAIYVSDEYQILRGDGQSCQSQSACDGQRYDFDGNHGVEVEDIDKPEMGLRNR